VNKINDFKKSMISKCSSFSTPKNSRFIYASF